MKTPFFLPYQKDWIEDPSHIKIMEKSRQIGISCATAYRALRRASTHPQTAIWIASRDYQQARLFLNDCKRFAKIFNQAFREQLIEEPQTNTVLQLMNGSTLNLMSSNINAQAGKCGSRILDEFALHDDPKGLYDIAYPGTTWGGQLEIISTHRGKHNFFNQLVEEVRNGGNPKNISLHRVTLEDALDQGFLEKLKTKLPPHDPRQDMDRAEYYNFIKNACASEKSFLQEYMCQPMDDSTTFLTHESITNCIESQALNQSEAITGPTFMGIDLARTQDFTAFAILEKRNAIYILRHLQCLKDAPFDQQESLLDHLFHTWNIQRACIDQTGIGRQFFERAQNRLGAYAIQGVQFTQAVKEQLAYPLKTHIDHHTLRLPQDDILMNDLLSLQIDEQGHLSAKHTLAGHADRFWAIALALHADQQPRTVHSATELFYANKVTRPF